MFDLFTATGYMSLQIGCSVEEDVPLKTTKRGKYSIEVHPVTFMIIVAQWSYSIFVILHSSSSKFTNNRSIH